MSIDSLEKDKNVCYNVYKIKRKVRALLCNKIFGEINFCTAMVKSSLLRCYSYAYTR